MTSSTSPTLDCGLDSDLLEVWTVLVRVYNVTPSVATSRVGQLKNLPITILDLDEATASSALHLAIAHHLDISDAALLKLTAQVGASHLP